MIGASLVILEVYGTSYWTPTYFLRVHGWSPAKTGVYIGIFQGLGGIFSASTAGLLALWFRKRGHTDGVWLVALIGAAGCTLFGSLAPIMPTPELALGVFIVKSLFVNYPTVGAMTAMTQITPNQHRGMVTAVYVILTGLFAQGLGPFLVGFGTDTIFHDPKAIGGSLAAVVSATGIIGIALLIFGRSAYRRSLAAVDWEAPAWGGRALA